MAPPDMDDPYEDDAAVKAQAVQSVAKLIKSSSQVRLKGAAGTDEAAILALDETISETSRRVLAWVERAAAAAAAAAAPHGSGGRRVFPPVLLTSCCRYMEALATAYPARFSADCRSLARPVASCVLVMTTMAEVHDSAKGVAVPCREDKGEGEENDDGLPSKSGRTITIEERNALELWVEMLGICLLPFCGSGGGSRTASRSGLAEAASGDDEIYRDPSGEHGDDPFDSDNEEEEDGADDDEEEGSRVSGDGKARSRWVAGWMRRAGVTLAEPLECPFDVWPGGGDEDLPVRLATLISYHAQAAASASRPASVSSLATVLAVLVAFTAAGADGEDGPDGTPSESHAAVVEEAFSCLLCLSETVPESSAQAECVKAALVSLKECAQSARLRCLEHRVPAALSMLEGVPSRLKLLLARRSQGAKVHSTARSFCREALAAAVACARKLIGLAGGPVVMDDSRWFLETFVVKMTSPLLLGDAVGALRAASLVARGMGTTAEGGEERGPDGSTSSGMETVLREVVLPGAVGRLIKALGSIDRYSAAAAKEVLKATAWLGRAAGVKEIRPHRNRLGMALVECAASVGRASGAGGGVERDEKVRLCLRAIRRLGAASGGDGDTAGAAPAAGDVLAATSIREPAAAQPFTEAALEFTCGVVEREWVGKRGERGEQDGGDGQESIITLVEAHVTLVALLRSPSMCIPGIGPDGEWPPAAKRLAKLAWAVAYRVRKAAGAVESSMALADDDVMLLCQGLEVLEALEECSGEFFEGKRSKLRFFEGDLSPVLTTLRGCHDKNTMHPVVYDACSWIRSTR
ncbi:unnamed protein product [Ectocarpus sp. CCAP 1310/34]|nr:unnamed protein product [Ectocarpus sp. CCAP 1310/34]